jgi:tetratricopeptide (TPR) repeat protein
MRINIKKTWLVGAGCILAACLLFSCGKNQVERDKEIFQAEKYRDLGELYFKEGKYTAALKEFVKSEKLNPDDHILHNDLGLTYMYKRKPDIAIVHFKKALALKDDYSPARNNLGNAYAEKAQWDKAIEQYEIVTQDLLYATPQYPLSNLGLAYYEKKDYARSEKYYLESLKIQKDFFMALYGLARTYMAMNRPGEAILKLKTAAGLAPEEPRVHFELGRAYSMNRDYKKGYEAYQEVVKLDPGTPLADKAQLEAQKIRHLF